MVKREDQKEAVCCLIFLLILSGLWLADGLCPDRQYSDWEKRLLAQKPKAGLADILEGDYSTAYEEWLTDQFPARDWWVSVKTRCELSLGKKKLKDIYIGKGGFLFSENTQTADWDALEDRMKELFGEGQVSCVHVPAAGAVLTDKVPDGLLFPARKDSIWENLYQHRSEYIFYRTDHHWTMLGAYYAYETWAAEQGYEPAALEDMKLQILKEDFLGTHYGKIHYADQADVMEFYDPGIICTAVYDLGDANISGLYQRQYLDTEDAYRFFLDGNHAIVQIETEREGGHLAVLKDSFANCFVPFLTVHYGKITVIDPRYFRTDIGAWLQEQEVMEVLILAQDTAILQYAPDPGSEYSLHDGPRGSSRLFCLPCGI